MCDALQDLDLVLLELTTLRRDGCNFTGAFDAAYERLLRKLLQQPGHPAVVSVNTYAFQAHRQHFYGVRRACYQAQLP